MTPDMRWIASIVCCLALAGCYRGGEPPMNGGSSAPPPAAPAIALGDNDVFQIDRLPAVSADGARVLIAIIDQDGARGTPNLRLELRDRSDTALAKHVVLSVEEDGVEPAALAPRIAAANRWLTEQHAAHRFAPLPVLQVLPDEGGIVWQHRAQGDRIDVDWSEKRLVIEHGGQRIVDRATPATWLAKPRPASGAGPCENPAFLRGAAVSVERRIALITIGYGGTDLCWEPDDAYRIVAW